MTGSFWGAAAMIVTGLISSLAVVPALKWVWYLWSCAAFLGVLYLLWVPLRAMAVERGEALGTAYQKNVAFLTVIWFLYPIVFLLAQLAAIALLTRKKWLEWGMYGVATIGLGVGVLAMLHI